MTNAQNRRYRSRAVMVYSLFGRNGAVRAVSLAEGFRQSMKSDASGTPIFHGTQHAPTLLPVPNWRNLGPVHRREDDEHGPNKGCGHGLRAPALARSRCHGGVSNAVRAGALRPYPDRAL